jgi:hypothetical protein
VLSPAPASPGGAQKRAARSDGLPDEERYLVAFGSANGVPLDVGANATDFNRLATLAARAWRSPSVLVPHFPTDVGFET